jgi:hypothetical protein
MRTAVARACGSGSGNQKGPDPIRSVIVERSAAYPNSRALYGDVPSAIYSSENPEIVLLVAGIRQPADGPFSE